MCSGGKKREPGTEMGVVAFLTKLGPTFFYHLYSPPENVGKSY